MLHWQTHRSWHARLLFALLFASWITHPTAAAAHEGPPFPILVDKPACDYLVSVWADPDIGEAAFYIVVETPSGELPSEEPDVAFWTEPVSERLERVSYKTERQPLRNRMQFQVQPYFDTQDMWTVGFVISRGDGQRAELTAEVESTPPGMGVWDLVIYLFPFLLFGGLWARGLLRRRRGSAQH